MALKEFRSAQGRLALNGLEPELFAEPLPPPVWIDLYGPTAEEEARVEGILGIDVPTREEMQEIEHSSRLYEENGALFMTAIVLSRSDTPEPESAATTFILAKDSLVTLRYAEPLPFETLSRKIERGMVPASTAEGVLMTLMEHIVDRLADIMEASLAELEVISRGIFRRTATDDRPDYQEILHRIGRAGDRSSKVKDSLHSLNRMVLFLTTQPRFRKDAKARLKILSRDVLSITEHANYVNSKVTFLLDATLGLINIEQNAIIKIFSVAAVAFLPPTLIASIYGMNFEHMPELTWDFGYPAAIVLMVLSAVLPFWYFKRRRWL